MVEHVDDVALILGRVGPPFEGVTAGGRATDVGVMAGGHRIETEEIGTLGETSELHRPVALDARVRRDTACVGIDVGGDDVLVEVVAEVEHQVIDPELLGDATGIVDIGHRAAPGVTVATPQLHRHANHLVARLLEQERRDR